MKNLKWILLLYFACIICPFPGASQQLAADLNDSHSELVNESSNPFENVDTILFILDCSKSMSQAIVVGRSKSTQFEQAKAVVRDIQKKLPKNIRCGLRLFGSTPRMRDVDIDCLDCKLSVPPKVGRSEILSELESLKPAGTSCMLAALSSGEADLITNDKSLIVLITSEKDECGRTVEDCINGLNPNAKGLRKVVVYSTASHVPSEGRLQDMRLVARATRGKYYDESSLNLLLRDAQKATEASSYH